MSKSKKLVIIGGSAAGPKAAARARRLDEHADITIVQRSPDLSMASCGYPYYVGGLFDDRSLLLSTGTGILRDPGYFEGTKGIKALVGTEALSIDRKGHKVLCRDIASKKEFDLGYDRLILATGAVPRRSKVPGSDLKGVMSLHSLQDADALRGIRDGWTDGRAVIIGGGLIGLETCEALRLSGLEVTIVELMPHLLPFHDLQLARHIEDHLRDNGVEVLPSCSVTEFLGVDGRLRGVRLSSGREFDCRLAVVAIGVKPESSLARDAGLVIGGLGGIVVDGTMRTSDPLIFAVGDCVETVHRLTGKAVHNPLGDLANLQGRVAGENAVLDSNIEHPGTIQTGICKVFDMTAGSTGLMEELALKAGYDAISVVTAGPDRPSYMGGRILISKMVADRKDGRVLGFQCVGHGDVSRQVSQAAMAIMGGMTVDELVNADLPYAPPYSPAIDNLIMTAQVLQNKMRGLFRGISAEDLKMALDRGEAPYLLDLRTRGEHDAVRLGLGERHIPLGELRDRTDELPVEKDRTIVCFCKVSMRGYEGARVLMQKGWENVLVLEGGVAAWPYDKEV